MVEEWNEGYIIEGCDRAHNLRESVNIQLLHHPAVVKAGMNSKVAHIMVLLGEVYQEVGGLDED